MTMAAPQPTDHEEHNNGASPDTAMKNSPKPGKGKVRKPERQIEFDEICRSLRDCARQIVENSRLFRENARQAQLRFRQREATLWQPNNLPGQH